MNTILVLAVCLIVLVSALVAYKLGIRKGAENLAKAKAEAAEWEGVAASRAAALDFQFRFRRDQELKALNK
jgi:hypothetical protein